MSMEVVGLGALNMDYLYRVERVVADGEAVVNEIVQSPGGSAANTIYGLAKLGVKTGFIGAVGDDADGKLLIEDLRGAGVDTSQVKIKRGARTGLALCLSDRLGGRSLYVVPGANNELAAEDVETHYIDQSGIFHISSFAGEQPFQLTLKMMDKLESTVKVSFAPGAIYAGKGMETLAPILSRTYVLFVNLGELDQLTGKYIDAGSEMLLKQGCRVVVVTLGRGIRLNQVDAAAYIRERRREYIIAPGAASLSEIETTGAGDAFAAGFLYGLLEGKELEECGRLGNVIARFSITRVGARPGLPTLDELKRRYHELYRKQL